MKKIKTLLAFAAVLICGGAWAADGDILASWIYNLANGSAITKDGVTYTLSGDSGDMTNNRTKFNADVTVSLVKQSGIASKGVKIDFPANTANKISVLVKYTGYDKPAGWNSLLAASFMDGTTEKELMIVNPNNTSKVNAKYGVTSDGDVAQGTAKDHNVYSSGYLLATFDTPNKKMKVSIADVDGNFQTQVEFGNNTASYWPTAGGYTGIKVGGSIVSGANTYRPTMRVCGVMICEGELTTSAAAAIIAEGAVSPAPMPVAVWDGFTANNLSCNCFSWTKSANTTIDNGVVTIGNDGGLTMVPQDGTPMKTAHAFTVIMEVEDIPSGAVTLLDVTQASNHVSLSCKDDNSVSKLQQRWNNGDADTYGSVNNFSRSTAHRIAFTYLGNGINDTISGTTTFVDGAQVMHSGQLQTSRDTFTLINIGGYNNNASNIAEGMKIKKLALFDSKLSGVEINDYKFPSESGVAHLIKPRLWTRFDGNFDSFGSKSISWTDTSVSYEDTKKGRAAYTGSEGQYPYLDSAMDWGSATSFTIIGSFKVAVGANQTNPTGLCGYGWFTDGFMLAALRDKVSLVCVRSHISGTTPIESEPLGIDLTEGFHSYALVADAATSTVKVYIDGVPIISKDNTTISLSSGWQNNNQKRGGIFSLPGGEMSGTVRNVDTRCDDYRVYGEALTRGQIAEIASEQLDKAVASVDGVDYPTLASAIMSVGSATAEISLNKTVAENVNIPANVTVDMNGHSISGVVSGSGVLIVDKKNGSNRGNVSGERYAGTFDWSIAGLTEDAWTGTVWLKNAYWANFHFATLGNKNSTVRLTNVAGYSYDSNNATAGFAGTLELVDDGSTAALTIDNAWNSTYFVGTLKGDGTFATSGGQSSAARYAFTDVSDFEGVINLNGNNKSVTIGSDLDAVNDYCTGNNILVQTSGSATIASEKTWTATTVNVAGKIIGAGSISGNLVLVDDAASVTVASVSGTKTTTVPRMQVKTVDNGDGTYTYTPYIPPVAKIGEGESAQYFETLIDALNAAGEAGGNVTVSLIMACSESMTIPANVTVEIAAGTSYTGTVSGSGKLRLVGNGMTGTSADTPTITGLTAAAWTGTVEIKDWHSERSGFIFAPNNYGHAQSSLVLNGYKGYIHYSGTHTFKNLAFEGGGALFNGSYGTGNAITFKAETITGSGTIDCQVDGGNGTMTFAGDASGFAGSVSANTKYRVAFTATVDETLPAFAQKTIVVGTGANMTLTSGKTWTAEGGVVVNGTIKGSGTFASNVTFGSTATIDTSAGVLTAQGTVAFGDKLTIKNPELDGVVLKKTSEGDFTGTPNVGLGYKLAKDDENIKYVRNYSLWNQANGIYTWTSGGYFHNGQAKIYSFATETEADIKTNMNTSQQLPKGQETITATPWYTITYNGGNSYVAPGYVFRLTKDSVGANASTYTIDGQFPNLAFAGLIIEKDAPAFTFAGTGNNNPERQTCFGDKRTSGGVETYFDINQNLTISRKQNNSDCKVYFYGRETWNIAAGKTVSLNADATAANCYAILDTGTAANVKIIGGGQIAVSTLTSTGAVTLDLSEQNAARETPVIVGTLAVDGSTTIKLPATMQVGETMKVASSISGELTQSKILLGSTASDEILWVIDAANGTITATHAPAAKIGEESYETLALAITAANEKIEAGAESVTITLARSNSEGAALGGKVTLDTAGRTYSGAVTGSGTIRYADFTVNNTTKTSLTQSTWSGTFMVDGFTNMTGQNLNDFGRTGSKVELKNVTGYFGSNASYNPEVVISGTFNQNSGYSGKYVVFAKLSGSGKFVSPSGKPTQNYFISDWSEFTGDIEAYAGSVIFGTKGSKNDYSATIRIQSDAVVTVPGSTWAANEMTVEGTLKGTGTINAPVTLGSTGVLDTTAGILNVASVEVASGATIKLSTTPAGDVKVMNFTATKNMPITAAVAVKVGEETLSGYGLAQKTDGLYVIQQTTLEWQGAPGSAITDDGVWTNGSFADNAEYGIFSMPAQTSQFVINVPAGTPDVSYITIVEGGNYKFVGEGQDWKIGVFNAAGATVSFENIKVDIDTTDITSEDAMKALVGTGAHVAIPHEAITLASGATLTLKAGLTYKLPIVPTLNNKATITIENAAKVVWGTNYKLLSWTTNKAQFTYGKPALAGSFTTPEGAGDARLMALPKCVYLQLRSAEQMERKPLTIWPFGDSITEGMNVPNSRANYRIPLCQKLSLAGYNVKTVGFSNRNGNNNFDTIDASGNLIEDEDWNFHSGVGGELAVRYRNDRGNLLDSWANALDQAGSPDIVLMHIGINDLDQVSNSDCQTHVIPTFVTITNIAARIIRDRPNTKVVMSSMNRLFRGQTFQQASYEGDGNCDGNKYYVKPVRDKLVELYEKIQNNEVPELPADRVFFADMYANIRPRSYDQLLPGEDGQPGLFISDNIHPDWAGHDIMSDTWLEQIKLAYHLSDGSSYNENNKVATAHKHGAVNNVPDEYMKGFKKARVLTPAGNGMERKATLGITNPHEIADNAIVEKIGYYVEYEFPSATTNIHRWVWVDMDAFEANMTVAKAGVPTETINKIVNKLHVVSNHSAVHTVAADTDGVNGFFEFTPFEQIDGNSGVSGAPTHWDKTSWNDRVNANSNYGAMQLHRIAPPADIKVAADEGLYQTRPAEVLFVYNAWNCGDDDKATEFGIGGFDQHYDGSSLDWKNMRNTKTMHSGKLTAKSIEIWVKPVAEEDSKVAVDPSAEAVEIAADDADAALAQAKLVISDAKADDVAGVAGQAQYLTLKATRVGESGNWKVQAVVDNAKLPANKKIDDTAVAFANAGGIVKLAGATEKQTISIPAASVTPGLYYSISFGTTPDNHSNESERVLATGSDVTIPVQALGNEKVYYIKVKASATTK